MALPSFAQNLKDVMRVILRSRLSLRRPTKRRPDGIWLPDPFHLGTCLCLVDAQYVAAVAVEEGRDPSIRDAMHVNRDVL